MRILELEIYDIDLDSNLVNSNQNAIDSDNTTLIDVYNAKRTFNKSNIISWNWKYLHLEDYNKLDHVCKKNENVVEVEVKDTADILNDSALIEVEKQINETSNVVIVKASKAKKLLVEKEIFCTVCGEISLNIPDNMLQCIECNVNVHKSCVEHSYLEICGVEINSNSDFKCISCTKMNDKKCCLCMCDDDKALYMLPTSRGCFFWAHCICIYAHQQSKVILGTDKDNCVVCEESGVAGSNNFQLMKCCGEKCKNLFHPTCAWVEGYEFSLSRIVRKDLVDGILIDPIELKAFCESCMDKRNSHIRKRVHEEDDEISESSTEDSVLIEEDVLIFEKYPEPVAPVVLKEWDGALKHIIGSIEVSSELEVSQGDETVLRELDDIKGIVKWEKVIHFQTFIHDEVVKGIENYGTDENVVLLKLSNINIDLRDCLKNCWALSTTKIPKYKYFLMTLQNHLREMSVFSNKILEDSDDSDIYMIGIKQYKEEKLFEVVDERRITAKVTQPEVEKENVKNEKTKSSKNKLLNEEFDKPIAKILKKNSDIIIEGEANKPTQPKCELLSENGSMSKYIRTLLEQPVELHVDSEPDENYTPLYDDQFDDCNTSILENDEAKDAGEEYYSKPDEAGEEEYYSKPDEAGEEFFMKPETAMNPEVPILLEQVEINSNIDIADFRNIFYGFVCSLPDRKCSLTRAKDWFKEMQGGYYDKTKSLTELLDIDTSKKRSRDGLFSYKNNFFSGDDYVEGYIAIADNDENRSVTKSSLENPIAVGNNSMSTGNSTIKSTKIRKAAPEKRNSEDSNHEKSHDRKRSKGENNKAKGRDGRKRDRSYSSDRERDRRERDRSYSRDNGDTKNERKKSNKPCLFYSTPGGCRKGNNCPFKHIRDDNFNRDISRSSPHDAKAGGKVENPSNAYNDRLTSKGLSNLPAWMTNPKPRIAEEPEISNEKQS